MIVVCDTSPIRSLVHLDRVDLLRLFERVLVPPAVVRELEYSTSSLPPLSDACRAYVEIEAPPTRRWSHSFCEDYSRASRRRLRWRSNAGFRTL